MCDLSLSVFRCRGSSGGALPRGWTTNAPTRKNAKSPPSHATVASTVAWKNASKWACPEKVRLVRVNWAPKQTQREMNVFFQAPTRTKWPKNVFFRAPTRTKWPKNVFFHAPEQKKEKPFLLSFRLYSVSGLIRNTKGGRGRGLLFVLWSGPLSHCISPRPPPAPPAPPPPPPPLLVQLTYFAYT